MATFEEIIAEEWRSRAVELADWAMQRLVNRKDVWGQYSVLTPTERRNSDRSYKAMTLPAVDQRDAKAERVTLDKLTRHFASRYQRKPQLIGLHAKSQDTHSLWLGIDIDNHAQDASSSDDLARRNLNAAVGWYQALQKLGYDPLLFDSNGAGGFHLWVLFREPAPTRLVYEFALATTADWEERQLERQPETFPKRVKDDSLGSWFRLPGLHHTRPHHARLWSGDDSLDDPWLTGHAAIDTMLECMPGPVPDKPGKKPVGTRRSRVQKRKLVADASSATMTSIDASPGDDVKSVSTRSFKRKNKHSVCVDLDGVLAHRTGNKRIGSPIAGAVEFTRQLQVNAKVIIHTARFSTTRAKQRSPAAVEALQKRIERWLDQHGFAWDTISIATAKPIASAYIDDRAVPCRPEDEGVSAFDAALVTVEQLAE